MKFTKNILEGQFIHRLNRFVAFVKLNEETVITHVPNTGRCKEILLPGSKVLLREENGLGRKTKYDLIAGYKGEKLINIDSLIPNYVVAEALLEGKIKELRAYNIIEREKTFIHSRFDFKLSKDNGEEYFLEIKGVTLEKDGVTMFPDAPTERGKKHMLELIDVRKSGRGAGVLFLIQLEGAKVFYPNDEMDKKFGEALRLAYYNGVDIYAYDCTLGRDYITLKNKIYIKLFT
ncbi:MAG TPA: DNA/RNA nuclease SfsA [Clostridiaceae bacterium]